MLGRGFAGVDALHEASPGGSQGEVVVMSGAVKVPGYFLTTPRVAERPQGLDQ